MSKHIILALVIGLLGLGGAAHAKSYTAATECDKINTDFPPKSPALAEVKVLSCRSCVKNGGALAYDIVGGKEIMACAHKSPQPQPDGSIKTTSEVIPLANQAAAQAHCPTVCTVTKSGIWAGEWTPNQKGKSAATCVCQTVPMPPAPSNAPPPAPPPASTKKIIEAGPLFNQAQAQNKCPSLCTAAGAVKWTGGWRTTIPNKMSVCECEMPGVASPTASPSFNHAPNGDFAKAHPDTIINYVAWDGSKWTAKFDGDRFVHAPNGDWSKSHVDTVIKYVTWDGSKWAARLEQRRFNHAPNGDFAQAHPDDIINYKTWDGAPWTARLVW